MRIDTSAASLAGDPADVVGGGWHWTLFKLGMTILRVGFGLVYLTNGLAKVAGFDNRIPPFKGFLIDYNGARSILESDTQGHPIGLYRDSVEDVILANWGFFGALVTVTEIAIGVCLILGLITPLAALTGAAFQLHINFANIHREDKWLWEAAVEWMPFLSLAFMRAGRFWGLDARLARRWPQWPIT
jgi:uncharacterized membrane protein YphA (DoxX/SURF4 family)